MNKRCVDEQVVVADNWDFSFVRNFFKSYVDYILEQFYGVGLVLFVEVFIY